MDEMVRQADLLLVRHGTTPWNREKRYLGHTDIPLDPGGRDELAPLARKLAGKVLSGVYCSDLARCRETLAIVSPAYADAAVYDPRLREMDFGAWEGHTYEQLQHEPLYRQWIDSPQQVTPPGGESWKDFAGRIDGFIGNLLKDVEKVCSKTIGTAIGSGRLLSGSKGIEIGGVRPSGSKGSKDSEAVLSRSEGSEDTGPELQALPEMLIVAHGGVLRQLAVSLVPGLSFWDVHVQPGSLRRIRLSFSEETGSWNGILVNEA
ncbi:alpha-ribazole phosphatase [Paenibacillus rhizosphaerae]|uniref:Alpha-ribazole phosphatase n=1 Tax=Paenibacillus rhizosphaerae TaxID=297318 RepID=A0A839TS44_9BACL|nr:histidine phosphatase family protein [Paenibacillus rhizosphaerae]MBB3129542.1 alpha-ribazole phosphatase [Paenibacillus rhizosphaerae]